MFECAAVSYDGKAAAESAENCILGTAIDIVASPSPTLLALALPVPVRALPLLSTLFCTEDHSFVAWPVL